MAKRLKRIDLAGKGETIVANLRDFITVKKLLRRIIEHDEIGYDDDTLVAMLRSGLTEEPAVSQRSSPQT